MNDNRPVICWTIQMRERLRKAFNTAVKAQQDTFVFEGNTFVTNYAKYLLEHLDNQLGPK
jgi:hypothetical protein